MTRMPATRRLARELLAGLEQVPPSPNIQQDFAAWRLERGHAHFTSLEGLCRMVLYELNPLVGGMTARAQAVLFDMNRVYEAYVAHLLRTQYPEWQVRTQVPDRALREVNGRRVSAAPRSADHVSRRAGHRRGHQVEAPESRQGPHLRGYQRRRLPGR